MKPTPPKSINTKYAILGVEVDALSIPAAVGQIMAVASDRKTAPVYVVKPYVEFLERAISEPELLTLMNRADWCLADGISLVWAAHYLYGGRPSLIRWLGTLAEIVLWPSHVRQQLPATRPSATLVDGLQNLPRYDAAESAAWQDWSGPRLSPKKMLGEGLIAAAAWQTILAVEAVRRTNAPALISVVGTNQQAIGAVFGTKGCNSVGAGTNASAVGAASL